MATIRDLVTKYIELRDRKDEISKEFKAKTGLIDDRLAKIEAVLLQQFDKLGTESVRTDAGTAFKKVRTSASVTDWEATLAFIREHDLWHMLDRRVNKTAVEQYRAENNDIPPGVNWREELTVNIRKAS